MGVNLWLDPSRDSTTNPVTVVRSPLTSVTTPLSVLSLAVSDGEQPTTDTRITARMRLSAARLIVLAVDRFFEFALTKNALKTTFHQTVVIYDEYPRFRRQPKRLDRWHQVINIRLEPFLVEA